MSDSVMSKNFFPPGTPVCVREVMVRRGQSIESETVGIVEAWEERPTGSWHAQGRNGKLQLQRLRLRKADGEITLLVLDDRTTIAKLEASTNPP